MSNDKFSEFAKQMILEYVLTNLSTEEPEVSLTLDDIYIVWMCKTLQNNKALLSTTVSDGMYYELTYDGDKKQAYLDAYKKLENQVITLESEED